MVIKNQHNINQSYSKCIGSSYNRTCLYSNIYYSSNKWWYFTNSRKTIVKCVAICSKKSNICFKPNITNRNIKYKRKLTGLVTYVRLCGTMNIGHLLFDNLYSIYLSLLKFNFRMTPFTIILSKNNLKIKNDWISIFEKFSMNRIIYEKEIGETAILIEKLIVGLAHQCQRCTTKDYSIPGGKEYKATWWMRKRMYYVYNLTKCPTKYGLIVNNKRFTKNEKKILHNVSEIFKSKYRIKYIDWRKYYNFFDQLQILICTNMYISGPGTGLLNFPFISDPGVIINLGGLYRGCPSFMEQYVEEGSPHFVSLYYPSNKRVYGLQKKEITILIERGLYVLNNWNAYKEYHVSNLNIEGEIFKRISYNYPQIMNKFLNDTDWSREGGIGIWAEKLIYFPYCYNKNYIADVVFKVVSQYENKIGCKISKSLKLCD